VFPHVGFLGLFLKALGYSLPLVWASNFTFLWLCFLFREFFLMNVALFSLVVTTFIAFLANFRAKNKAKNRQIQQQAMSATYLTANKGGYQVVRTHTRLL